MSDHLETRNNPSSGGRLGKLWFRFSGTHDCGQDGRFIDSDYQEIGNGIMDANRFNRNGKKFNDIDFYEQLCQKEGCTNVEISCLRVSHSNYCFSVNTEYRLTFRDGSTELARAPYQAFDLGYYRNHHSDRQEDAWCRQRGTSIVSLQPNEFITGIRIWQGEILDGVTFVTNLQEHHCGGHGGSMYDTMVHNPPLTYIVAFCATEKGVMERIGFYAKPFGWHYRGTSILMRELVEQGRAEVRQGPIRQQNCMQQLVLLNDDVFQRVMRFV